MDDLSFFGYLDPTQLTTVDLGTVAPRSSADVQIRVTNLNEDYTATAVAVGVDGPHADQLLLSVDGEVFTQTVALGDLPASASSAPFWLRRVTPSTATAGACTATLTATAQSWALPLADAPALADEDTDVDDDPYREYF